MATMTVEIELENFSDEEIKDEFYERNLGGGAETWDEEAEMMKVYQLHHAGKKDEAYEILWQHCLIKLNRIV